MPALNSVPLSTHNNAATFMQITSLIAGISSQLFTRVLNIFPLYEASPPLMSSNKCGANPNKDGSNIKYLKLPFSTSQECVLPHGEISSKHSNPQTTIARS
eukprot:NODE_126_length_17250_cov_2.558743.p18 type:complete len:101 gc:universal NODE_126_length_17250_cov_2.558743:14132-13830(-)